MRFLSPRHRVCCSSLFFTANSKNAAGVKAVAEREGLTSVNRDLKAKRAALAVATDSLEVAQRKLDKLKADEANMSSRKATVGQAPVIGRTSQLI